MFEERGCHAHLYRVLLLSATHQHQKHVFSWKQSDGPDLRKPGGAYFYSPSHLSVRSQPTPTPAPAAAIHLLASKRKQKQKRYAWEALLPTFRNPDGYDVEGGGGGGGGTLEGQGADAGSSSTAAEVTTTAASAAPTRAPFSEPPVYQVILRGRLHRFFRERKVAKKVKVCKFSSQLSSSCAPFMVKQKVARKVWQLLLSATFARSGEKFDSLREESRRRKLRGRNFSQSTPA